MMISWLLLIFHAAVCSSLAVTASAAMPNAVSNPPVANPAASFVTPHAVSTDHHHALVLCTQGLEDVASEFLVRNQLVTGPIEVLSQPRVALGEAAIGKLLVRIRPDQYALARLQQAPVVQAVLAFVAAADNLAPSGSWTDDGDGGAASVPEGVLSQVASLVGSSEHWKNAIELLESSGVEDVQSFRASCAVSGRTHEGAWGCDDAMRAMGGGVLASTSARVPAWGVDLYRYDVELFGVLCDGCFACGLLLGGEWRTTANPKRRQFGLAPFCEGTGRPHLSGSSAPWWMPRLRPSTAMLLLLLAGVRAGETVLDPFGGSGTIAIEAAIHLPNVQAITADIHRPTASFAIRNIELARGSGLAAGSEVVARDWDATNLSAVESASIDRVVADLPFGHRCRWDVETQLPAFLSELRRVLKRGTGRAVLLLPGYQRVAKLLGGEGGEGAEGEEGAEGVKGAAALRGLLLEEKRRVGVGGFGCWALTLSVSDSEV